MTKRRGNLGWGSLLVVFVGLGLLPGCSGNDKKPDEATSSRQVAEMYRKQESVTKSKGPAVDDDFEY